MKVGEEHMTTVVNNETPQKESGEGGNGFFAGIVLLIIFLGVILYFAIPAIRNMQPIQVNVPAPQVNVEAPKVESPAPQGEPAPATQ